MIKVDKLTKALLDNRITKALLNSRIKQKLIKDKSASICPQFIQQKINTINFKTHKISK